jgi:hypothetical protein
MNSDLSLAAQRGWKIFPLLHSSRFAVRQPLLHHATSNEARKSNAGRTNIPSTTGRWRPERSREYSPSSSLSIRV